MIDDIGKMVVTFADVMPNCELYGHSFTVTKDWQQIPGKYGLYIKISICKECGLVEKTTRYKWMPERTEYYFKKDLKRGRTDIK